MLNTYQGSCHCGTVRFEAELDLSQASYRAGVGNETPIGKMYGANIGCLEDVTEEELSSIPITSVDGISDQWAQSPRFFSHL